MEKRKAIDEEVARLLAAEFIREIYHSEWLANVVMVPKKDDSLCMCTSISIEPARKIIFRSPASTRLLTQLRGVSVCLFWIHISGIIRSDCMDPMR